MNPVGSSCPSQLMVDRCKLVRGVWSDGLLYRSNIGVAFAAVGNSIPSVFWTISCILADDQATVAVRKEVNELLASRNGKSPEDSPFSLEELDKLVFLKSSFLEAVRMYSSAFSPRDVVEDTVYQSKAPGGKKYIFKKGTRVMSYFPIRHYDAEIFADPEVFKYDRFAPDPVTGKPPSFSKYGKTVLEPLKIFGGGEHMCPGRRFIGYEARHFLACLFAKFDMRLAAPEEGLPLVDKAMEGVGVSQPNKDMYIEMFPKKK